MTREGFVWPGVKTMVKNYTGGNDVASKDVLQSPRMESRQFSFDWSRGHPTGNGKREQSTPFLSAWGTYGEGAPFTSRQRWKHFVLLLLLSGLMFVLAGLFLPLVLLRPQKFCLFFTLGSVLSMASFAVLRGPIEQLKHMFSLQRLPFTSTYLGSMVFTLYAALVLQSYLLVMLFTVMQACALGWYLLSYIPGGAPILRLLTRTSMRAVAALCCRSGGGSWGSWSASNSLLPL